MSSSSPAPPTTQHNSELFQALISRQWAAALRILRKADAVKKPSPLTSSSSSSSSSSSLSSSHDSITFQMQSRTFPTALHLACFRRDTPLEVVTLLLRTSPESAFVRNENGNTPLHFSIAMSSEQIILALVRACPAAAKITNKKGETPLYYAISRYRALPIIKALVRADPTNIGDDMENSPLFLFCALWHSGIRSMKTHFDSLSAPAVLQLYIQNYEGEVKKVKELYDITCLLMKAAVYKTYLGSKPDKRKWLPVHESIKIRSFPWTFFYLLIKANPSVVRTEDKDGNLPIHLMAASPLNGHHVEKTRILLNECEKSASLLNPKGKLPLHLIAEKCYDFESHNASGAEEIFYGAPEALRTRDMESHLLPFMTAAAEPFKDLDCIEKERRTEEEETQARLNRMTMSFFLLMEDPTLLVRGIPCDAS